MEIPPTLGRKWLVRSVLVGAAGLVLLLIAWRWWGQKLTWQGVHISGWGVGLALLGASGFLVGRTWRFAGLLHLKKRGLKLLGVTGISWGAGLLLPGPAADVSLVALVRTRLGVGVAVGTGAALVARILDVISLALVVLVGSLALGSEVRGVVRWVAAGVGLLGVLGLVLVLRLASSGIGSRQLARWRRISMAIQELEGELAALHWRGDWSKLIISTGFCRVASLIQYSALLGMVGLELGFWKTWFVLGLRTLLLTIPIQGFAGIGTGQAWWAGALLVAGVTPGVAVGAGLTLQGLDLAVSLPVAGLAGLGLWLARR